MKIEIDPEDFGALCICALRYCHGRQTYMPSVIQGICRAHIGAIENNDLRVMLEDCDFQERMHLYGDERIDKPGWIAWKDFIVAEQKRRFENAKGMGL